MLEYFYSTFIKSVFYIRNSEFWHDSLLVVNPNEVRGTSSGRVLIVRVSELDNSELYIIRTACLYAFPAFVLIAYIS